jgi:NADPH-ferrihemoprotein reductase
MPSPLDLTIIALTLLLPIMFWFRESLPFIGAKRRAAVSTGNVTKAKVDEGDPRDFVGKMERAVSITPM